MNKTPVFFTIYLEWWQTAWAGRRDIKYHILKKSRNRIDSIHLTILHDSCLWASECGRAIFTLNNLTTSLNFHYVTRPPFDPESSEWWIWNFRVLVIPLAPIQDLWMSQVRWLRDRVHIEVPHCGVVPLVWSPRPFALGREGEGRGGCGGKAGCLVVGVGSDGGEGRGGYRAVGAGVEAGELLSKISKQFWFSKSSISTTSILSTYSSKN